MEIEEQQQIEVIAPVQAQILALMQEADNSRSLDTTGSHGEDTDEREISDSESTGGRFVKPLPQSKSGLYNKRVYKVPAKPVLIRERPPKLPGQFLKKADQDIGNERHNQPGPSKLKVIRSQANDKLLKKSLAPPQKRHSDEPVSEAAVAKIRRTIFAPDVEVWTQPEPPVEDALPAPVESTLGSDTPPGIAMMMRSLTDLINSTAERLERKIDNMQNGQGGTEAVSDAGAMFTMATAHLVFNELTDELPEIGLRFPLMEPEHFESFCKKVAEGGDMPFNKVVRK